MEKARILIVDDEEIFVRSHKKELEQAGYEVKTALSGKEAVEIVKKESFDVVYVDLIMPEINGVEVCQEIKGIRPDTEVVLISGHLNHVVKYRPAFIAAGGRDKILRKPLLNGDLPKVTEDILKEIEGDKR